MSKLKVTTDIPNEIHMTRVFDAPRHLVIRAMTSPELLKRWLGAQRATLVTAEVDLRIGGKYRYEYQLPNGGKFAFVGTFRELSPERIVHTESFEGQPGESLCTTTYVEDGGKTTMTLVIRFESQALRDRVLATGMADGASESYDELETLLTSL
jgi:uncharacterized protein YndB with AHSA1/START domain